MSYVFDPRRPPLLREMKGAVINIPSEQTSTLIGKTGWDIYEHWNPNDPVTQPTPERPPTFNQHQDIWWIYEITRHQRWFISRAPQRYSEDTTEEIVKKTGYSRQEKLSIERTTGREFTMGGSLGQEKIFGLTASAKITSELKITSDLAVTWTEEQTTTTTRIFRGGHTYITWSLADVFELKKTYRYMVNDNLLVDRTETPVISCIISTYEDVASDKEIEDDKSNEVEALFTKFGKLKEKVLKHTKLATSVDKYPCKVCGCRDFLYLGGYRCARSSCGHDCEDHEVC